MNAKSPVIKILATVLFLWFPQNLFAQANAKVPNPDPEEERKSFIVAEGFEVNLFASDPLLAKPIQMNFDPQGRLWVACSEVYPQIKPGQKANDKILILEDTKGTGQADKVTVFADGLLIPTGVEPGDGGAYVANSTELIHLSASKPGGKADKTRVMLSGFGTEDTHHIIHTFRWGPDGLLYFNQSIYIHSHLETPKGVKRLNGGGIWAFRPESLDLEVFVRGFVNTWGHHFDRWGQSLITDGAYGEGINHGVPGAYYVTAVGASRILKGLNPGSPKHCGLEVISGRHLPESWQGDVITNDFRGHRVCRFKLSEDGSTFASREMTEVIKTNHAAFRPIDVKMGPDGAIYIADWYNPIIQHGEVDFRDPRRDHTHGRIWRITAKGRPLVERPNLVGAKTPELLDFLKVPEDWTRQQTKRVLKERGANEVLPALEKWWTSLDNNDKDYEHHLLEALWVYQSLQTPNEKLLKKLLGAKTFQARAAAVRVLSAWKDSIPETLSLLKVAVQDTAPRVRLEAVRALGQIPSVQALQTALLALDAPMDRTLDYALWLTVRELEPIWLPKFKAEEDLFAGNTKQISFVLEASASKDLIKPLLKLARSETLPAARRQDLWLLLARVGGPNEFNDLVTEGLKNNEPTYRLELLQNLEAALRQPSYGKAGKYDAQTLIELAQRKDSPLSPVALRVLGLAKDESQRNFLEAKVTADDATTEQRRAALEGLLQLGGPATRETLNKLVAKDQKPLIRLLAVEALSALDLKAGAPLAAEILANGESKEDYTPLFQVFLTRKGGGNLLAQALENKKIPADTAKLGLRVARSFPADGKVLGDALTKAGQLGVAKTMWSAEEIQAYVNDVQKLGDAARGESIYRRKELNCLNCHAIAGAGGLVGPDMTSIGASAQIDYLVESILIPNKAVKEGYHAIKVTRLGGQSVIGIKTKEADGKLYLRTSEDQEVAIPLDDIDERKETPSLMPAGLADPLTRQEFVDLVRFLSELGKVGPYAPNKARLIRRWDSFEKSNENLNLLRRNRAADAAENPQAYKWSPLYSKVSGELPLDELNRLEIWTGTEPLYLVQAKLDVTTAGRVALKINNPQGLTLWVNGKPTEVKPETILELPMGIAQLTFAIEPNKRKENLRVEVEDVPGSAGRAQPVNGK